jgi:symplekin
MEETVEEPIVFTEFHLPPPEPFDASEKDYLVDSALERIWGTGADLASLPNPKETDRVRMAVHPKEMWMMLLARLQTRGGEDKRKAISGYVVQDFAERCVSCRIS